MFEILEDRTVPSTLSSIVSNFNGNAIPAGDTIWFNSVLKVKGLGSAPVNVHVTNQEITFNAGGTSFALNVPDSNITFSPTTTTGTTSFDAGHDAWISNLPATFSGNAFLGGYAFQVAAGLPGGINPVTWQASFATDTAGVTLQWQWAAAVYTNFGADYNSLDVKPLDSDHATIYPNSDHAGTPEAFRSFVVGGARGGGGSNFTGSYSATASVVPTVANFEQPASISGYALDARNNSGLSGVTITLTGTDNNGNPVTLTAVTDSNGFYQFISVMPGSYTLSSGPVPGYTPTTASAGTVSGVSDGAGSLGQITGISLGSGDAGINYDFYYLPKVIGA
jgi:hypothetical protein